MYGGYDGQRGPPRAGIGAQGAAQNPHIPNLDPSSSNGAANPVQQQQHLGGSGGEKYSLFLSGIPPSLDDRFLQDILESVGSLIKVNRIRDASGKPKGFGFAEYGDAESVLHCLEIINGVTLVGRDGETKPLTVKADAKVRERLDAHEASRMNSSQLEDQLAFSKDALQEALTKMMNNTGGGRTGGPEEGEELNPDGTKKYKIPSHLQDLAPDELPEESRGVITREIAFFRERAAKREEANRLAEQQRDRARRDAEDSRRMADARRQQPAHDARSPRADQGSSRFGNAPAGPRAGAGVDQQQHRRRDSDSRPMDGFVASSSNGPASSSSQYPSGPSRQQNGMSDEDAERQRQQRRRDQADQQFRSRLLAWEKRERGRLANAEREKKDKMHDAHLDDRRRTEVLQKCMAFDDDEEMDKGDELFIVDRARWRKSRRQAKQREIEQDARDARLEAEQAEAMRKESEDFLNRQAELFASMKGTTAAAEAGSGEPTKFKLSAAGPAVSKGGDDSKAKAKTRAPAVFAGDEEDEADKKKKRELIPLSYSDDEDEETKAEKKKRKLKDLVSAIPTDKEGLWSYEVRWDKMSETMVKDKLRPFVAKKSVEYLGSEEEEVIDTVLENMRAHKGPAELADELEPVLAEEAEEFVIKVYRHLNFEILSAINGIKL